MKTTQTKRLRRVAIGMAAVAAIAFGTLPAISSSADVPAGAPNFAVTSNASDPHIYRCEDNKYCMVTSQDLGTIIDPATGQPYPNVYPMKVTRRFASNDGLSWTTSTGLNESALVPFGAVSNANHLWAPAMRYSKTGPGGGAVHGLYVPDLTRTLASGAPDNLSSKIFYATDTNSSGSFTPVGKVTGGTGAELNAYMSDPEVFSDATNPNDDLTKDYLIWANGDNGTCGGFSIRKMTGPTTLQAYTTAAQVELKVTGFPTNWGNCNTDDPNYPHPYIEGASMYKFANWNYKATDGNPMPGTYTLVFAAKPSVTPDTNAPGQNCKAPGQPGTENGGPGSANEVIAYATSNTLTGPFAYQGILMCGSSTEWTNQATLQEVKVNNSWHVMIVYHDGAAKNAGANINTNRKLRSECLYTDASGKFISVQRSTDGATTVSGAPAWCLGHSDTVAIKTTDGRYVRSDNNGGNRGLQAKNTSIGPWEQFSFDDTGNIDWLQARNPGAWAKADPNQGNKLIANQSTTGFSGLQFIPSGSNFKILDKTVNKHVRLDANGYLVADATLANGTIFTVEYLTKNLPD